MSWFLDKVDISSITMFKGILITAAALLVIEKGNFYNILGSSMKVHKGKSLLYNHVHWITQNTNINTFHR